MVTSDIPGHPSHAKPREMLIFPKLNSDRHSLYKAEESYKMYIYWMYQKHIQIWQDSRGRTGGAMGTHRNHHLALVKTDRQGYLLYH